MIEGAKRFMHDMSVIHLSMNEMLEANSSLMLKDQYEEWPFTEDTYELRFEYTEALERHATLMWLHDQVKKPFKVKAHVELELMVDGEIDAFEQWHVIKDALDCGGFFSKRIASVELVKQE
jgi:hypothetical protein